MKQRSVAILLFLFLFGYAIIGFAIYFNDWYQSRHQINHLIPLMESAASHLASDTELSFKEEVTAPLEREILPEFEQLYEQNADTIGWLTIEQTPVNYPVMQNPDNPDYYLDHDFKKQRSIHGLPFLDSRCDLIKSRELLIHGHNMKTGLIFGELMRYKKQSYYQSHKTIQFHTLYEKADYEIIAVILSRVYEKTEQGFRYYHLEQLQTREGFDFYMEQVNQLALYQTGKTAEFGDGLLILSTCEYSFPNGRLAVIARRIG